MKHKIFFSWQSDLPNSTNRNFIEKSIRKAIKEIDKDKEYLFDLNIDRDTINTAGSPEITESIFTKIDSCSFFVADISLINGCSQGTKKTPNPNVLLELGYAVHKLGWERVVCVFNKDFGAVDELPFDLRNRRVLIYETVKNKESEGKKLTSIFKSILEDNYTRAIFSNELMDYYNADIYLSVLRIIFDISKVLLGYEKHSATLLSVQTILNYSYDNIRELLSTKRVLGFQIFKSYEAHTQELCCLLEKIVIIKNFNDDYYVPIVRLINTLRLYNKALNRQDHWNQLQRCYSQVAKYSIHGDTTNQGENRLMLLRKIEVSKSEVIDFGDFQRKDHIEALLTEFELKEYTINFYSGFFSNVIKDINSWNDNNGGEFIVDQTQLEIK